jgi:hypothetical protein
MKFHINLIVTLLFFLATNLLQAQDKSEAFTPNSTEQTNNAPESGRYQEEAIFLKNNFWQGQMYVKNGVAYRVGFNGRLLKKEFEGFPVAQEEFKKYQKQHRNMVIVALVGATAAIAGYIGFMKRTLDAPNPDDVVPNSTESTLLVGGLAVEVAAASWGTLSSNNSLQKAIFLRNQALCEGK